MRIRNYQPTDCDTLIKLFYDTVHTINIKDYIKEQIDAWANSDIDKAAWNRSFLMHNTLIAEIDQEIVGFGDIDHFGYLDKLYVHKAYQHCGIASALCDQLEYIVMVDTVITDASISAKAFFQHRGYHLLQEQQVIRKGISLTNYKMIKHLSQTHYKHYEP